MDSRGVQQLKEKIETALPEYSSVMLCCIEFINWRMLGAAEEQKEIEIACGVGSKPAHDIEIPLHSFLRECWDALNGTGKLVNCALYEQHADAGLCDPSHMTRQCTFYTVRRALCSSSRAHPHPTVAIIRQSTRENPVRQYRMLSYLYNISLFAPLPLSETGEIADYHDLPAHMRKIIKPQDIATEDATAATRDILDWVVSFVDDICRSLNPLISPCAGNCATGSHDNIKNDFDPDSNTG